MYLRIENCFDGAHFLKKYQGKCKNLHGHRWKVIVTLEADYIFDGSGITIDFTEIKEMLKKEVDIFDHKFIYEKDSLKKDTVFCLQSEGFDICEVAFAPTAENFAIYFYNVIHEKGYKVKKVNVYETPNNCVIYTGNK